MLGRLIVRAQDAPKLASVESFEDRYHPCVTNLRKARWFGCRSIIRWPDLPTDKESYEERITIWRADSPTDAMALAEAESAKYAAANKLEDLGFTQVYEMITKAANGAEVFSLIRDSYLQPDEYLNSFIATGGEREGEVT